MHVHNSLLKSTILAFRLPRLILEDLPDLVFLSLFEASSEALSALLLVLTLSVLTTSVLTSSVISALSVFLIYKFFLFISLYLLK